MKQILDVAFIGGGPVGIFGLFQAGMLNLKAVLFDSNSELGGQCKMLYGDKNIYDIPGFYQILAKDLISNLEKQISRFSHEIISNTHIVKIEKKTTNGVDIFELHSEKEIFLSKSVIVSVGAGFFTPNKIPIKNAQVFENKTLFYSVTEKSRFMEKKICILGGGDSALDWAIEFANLNCEVSIVHRRDFTGHPSTVSEMKSKKSIKPFVGYSVKNITGDEVGGLVKKVEIEDQGGQLHELDADYIFCFFGLSTSNVLLKNSNIENKFNCAVIKDIFKMETNISGIFAAGDCAFYDGKLKLILTGFSEIATAVNAAYKFIHKKSPHFQHSTSNNLIK